MTPDLDDYEAAFDGAQPPLDPDLAWRRIERAVRRRVRGPTLELLAGLLGLGACIAAGLSGVEAGWGFAVFLLLVDLPQRWRARKRWRAEIAAVESARDVRALCREQAKERAARALGAALLLSLLGLLYAAVALVAHFAGRSPWPGAVAALVILAWAAFQLLVRLPLAARESAILDVGD